MTGTKTLPNVDGDWEIYRLTLDESGETSIDFDAGDSSDQDALSGNGITTYEWTVYNDEPYGEFRSPKGVYTENAASQGEWTYTFRNVTIDAFGEQEAQIRIELIVTDGAQKTSQKFRLPSSFQMASVTRSRSWTSTSAPTTLAWLKTPFLCPDLY